MNKKIIVLVVGILMIGCIFAGKISKNLTKTTLSFSNGDNNSATSPAFSSEGDDDWQSYVKNATIAKDDNYENVWIRHADKENIYGHTSNGDEVVFTMPDNNELEIAPDELVADIIVKSGVVKKVRLKRTIINDVTAREVTDEVASVIESDVYGRIGKTDNFKEYIVNDKERKDRVYLVFEGKDVCALIHFEKIAKTQTVSAVQTVNVTITGAGDDRLTFKSDGNITVKDLTDKKNVASGKSVKASCKDGQVIIYVNKKRYSIDNRHKLSLESDKGKMYITSRKKYEDIPYYGKFVVKVKDKKLVLINKVDMESYVCGVVAAEMPSKFDKEALAAQAVCARTYAVSCMDEKNTINVDDTTAYQVYNSTKPDNKVREAVSSTKGKVLTYKGKTAKTYFFSTSSGYTADCKDVFMEDLKYLSGSIQTKEDYSISPTISIADSKGNEENIESMGMKFSNSQFTRFLQMRGGYLESESPWFSWKVSISQKNMIKMLNNSGFPNVRSVEKIMVKKRGTGGIIKEIKIKTDSGNIIVSGQNDIRKVLAPVYDVITKKDGSKVENFQLLPSAFFSISASKNGAFLIKGAGFGHGTGLSQYGADAMAKNGSDYKEILSHYFPGTKLSLSSSCDGKNQ